MDRYLSNPVHSATMLGKVDHRVSASDQLTVRYSLYTSPPTTHAARRAHRGDRIRRPGQHSTTPSLSATPGQSRRGRSTRPVFNWRTAIEAPPSDLIGPAVSIAVWRPSARRREPDTAAEQDVTSRQQSFPSGRRARAAGGRGFRLQRRQRQRIRGLSGQLFVRVTPQLPTGNYSGFTQTFATLSSRRPTPTSGLRTGRVAYRIGPTLNLCAYDLQYLETITTETNNVSPRAGSRGHRQDHSVGPPWQCGVFYDRVPLRAVANAIPSAGNTTESEQPPSAERGRAHSTQDGAPTFPILFPREF
jgi:hypothetical protein